MMKMKILFNAKNAENASGEASSLVVINLKLIQERARYISKKLW